MTAVDIGLVNNMPDPALEATARQFVTLLNEAAGNDFTVRLTFYALPNVPRTNLGRRALSSYSGIDDLWSRSLDGIIVTGTEPVAANLKYEPYWSDLTQLVEWADQNTSSAVWSCLAAHAVVLYTDGILRCRFSEKRFGIFDHLPVSDNFLTAGAPSRLRIPHSRWNGLQEDELRAADYDIVTRSEDGSVDAFVKRRKSLFVFFQGHPEYEADTLLLEYRRDIKRFLRHESDVYPSIPNGYSNPAWTDFRQRALSDRREEIIGHFPSALATGAVTNTWRNDAVRLYHNWLLYLVEHKGRTIQPQIDYSSVPPDFRGGDSFGRINPSRKLGQ
jgi:homoserine O-succinyltransferase